MALITEAWAEVKLHEEFHLHSIHNHVGKEV